MLSTVQAAAKLKLSRRRVLALIAAGRLPAKRFADTGVYMIREADLAKVRNRKPGRPRNEDR